MFSKLFGRKDTTPETQSNAQEAARSMPSVPDQAMQNLSGEGFGLMFSSAMFSSANGETKTFTSLPITIGRGENSALVLHDPSVSIQHAYVYYDERLQQVCIADLDSTNGIFINDRPTRRNILQDDARIQIGGVTLTFRDTGYIHPGA